MFKSPDQSETNLQKLKHLKVFGNCENDEIWESLAMLNVFHIFSFNQL